MTTLIFGGGGDAGPQPDAAESPQQPEISPEDLKLLVTELVKDEQNAFILTWIDAAISPLKIKALETAVALFRKPDCNTLQQLYEHRPEFSEESLKALFSPILTFINEEVSFANDSTKAFFSQNRPLDNLALSVDQVEVARACVTYLALDDFRDLPLPNEFKGHRSDLETSDPFLTYASKHWHKHIHSASHADALEPALDRIIDPSQNNLYLWTDQSSGCTSWGGSRHFFRSRTEVTIKYDLQWLVEHLLDKMGMEMEEMFPARDLVETARKSPGILRWLVRRKPDYYRTAITKKILAVGAKLDDEALETLQVILPDDTKLHLPAIFLGAVAANRNGDQIFEWLFSKYLHLPITNEMLLAASANDKSGDKILQLFFCKDPSIRVTSRMIAGAISAFSTKNIRFLFEHDPDAPVTEGTLQTVVRMEIQPKKLQILLEVKPDIEIPPKVVELAVQLNRAGAVRIMFNKYTDLEVTEQILKIAAGSDGHDLEMTQFLLTRCPDSALITAEVLSAAISRLNSAHKMVSLLLNQRPELQITDQMLIESAKDWDGQVLSQLLPRWRHPSVPTKLVDLAVEAKKHQLHWTFRKPDQEYPSLLSTLQQHVPNDHYLKRVVKETDFTPPPPKPLTKEIKQTDLPDAANNSDISEVKRLLSQGISIDTTHGSTCSCDRNHGQGTALQRAVMVRDVEMTKLLLDHGANPDIQDGKFGNPLQEAARVGDLELMALLVKYKASINIQGGQYGSPLISAARANDVKAVRILLDGGADINIADENGWTPYLHAVANESHDAASVLLEIDKSLGKIGELIALPPGRLVKSGEKSSVRISEDGLTVDTGTL
jgi:hypothetical protein